MVFSEVVKLMYAQVDEGKGMMKEHTKRWGGRKAVGEYLFNRSRDEGGFTIVELALYMILLLILVSIAVFSFANMQSTSLLNSSATQAKFAVEHALNVARNENQLVTMHFYGSSTAGHPNSYDYIKADNTQDRPPGGSSYYTESGVYYVKMVSGESGVTIESDVTMVFNPQGTVLTVTPADIVIKFSGKSRTIHVNATGQVTY